MSYLCDLCLFAYSDVQHILCCVFALFVLVLCTLCCQFLCIVHSWLPFRYSLMFIYKSIVTKWNLNISQQRQRYC